MDGKNLDGGNVKKSVDDNGEDNVKETWKTNIYYKIIYDY